LDPAALFDPSRLLSALKLLGLVYQLQPQSTSGSILVLLA
jgi:hypothetical protein